MGDKVTIRIVSANLAKRQLDYEWVITAGAAVADGPADMEVGEPAGEWPGEKPARKRTAPDNRPRHGKGSGTKGPHPKPPKKTARKKKK